MKDQRSRAPASVNNIYRLDGRVPVGKAIPFGLQHVLAMFVANVMPVMLIASVAVYNGQTFTDIDTALLIQAAMLVAGIGTLILLYPVWRIGSRLPVVMGLSFTFLSAMMTLAAKDYGLMIGAVIVKQHNPCSEFVTSQRTDVPTLPLTVTSMGSRAETLPLLSMAAGTDIM